MNTDSHDLPFTHAGILKDARHLVSSARAAWRFDHEQDVGAETTPPPPPPPAPAPPSSSSSSNLTGLAAPTPESASAFGGSSVGTSNDDERASLTSSRGDGTRDEEEERETDSKSLPVSGGGSGGARCGDDGYGQKKGRFSRAGVGGASLAVARAYVPVHGLLFLLCDLHMKTPEEILEKVQ